jgi:hypothetical protein
MLNIYKRYKVRKIFNEAKQQDKELLDFEIFKDTVEFIYARNTISHACLPSLTKIAMKINLSWIGFSEDNNNLCFLFIFLK